MTDLKTKFGTLRLPRQYCITCIASRQFMACTRCEYMDQMEKDARKALELKQ